jgi:UDP-glucose 4-epimerase
MSWLIVGGAGYIGSHIAHHLAREGLPLVVLDDLSTGRYESVPSGVPLEVADASDSQHVSSIMERYSVSGIIHLAARKHARESVRQPLEYWRANVGTLLGVLQAADAVGIDWFLLSSSCSVYGSAGEASNSAALDPQSPYGATKVASEMLVRDWCRSRGIPWVALRYFNVIGNGDFPFAPDRSSECLVPAVAGGIREGRVPTIFGTDFETPDGTALRDFVDVRDVAKAHALVARKLEVGGGGPLGNRTLNIATGEPTSVLQVIQGVADALGWTGEPLTAERRPGDPERVWAEPSAELTSLGWMPQHSTQDAIESFVRHSHSTV